MKKTISLFAVLMLLFVAAQSFAQINFGAKAGLNLANMTSQDDENNYAEDAPYEMKTGFHVGITAAFSISENLAIEPGVLYSAKGFAEEYSIANIKYNIKYNINYLEVPINAVYTIDAGSVKVLVFAGPYLGYAISAKVKSDKAILGENGDQKEETISIGTDKEKDGVVPFDFGINFGAGAEISSISVSFQYGLGLANTSPHSENSYSSKNKVIGISLGYKFGGK